MKSLICVGAGLVLLFCTQNTQAKTLEFPAVSCQCKVPDSWIFKPEKAQYLVFAVRPSDGAVFILQAIPVPIWRTLDSSSLKLASTVLDQLHSFTLDSSSFVILNQQRFLSQSKRVTKNGILVYVHSFAIYANGYRYDSIVSRLGADPMSDAELREVAESLSFTSPPHIHKSSPVSFFEKISDYQRVIYAANGSYRLVYIFALLVLIGRYVLGPLVAIVTVSVVGFFIWWRVARKPTAN